MALTDSLISYWALNEASGDALDSHGSNTLTETSGAIGATTGKVGGARDFEDGDTEYFGRADNADLSTGDIDFTIACWVMLESNSAMMGIAAKDAGDSTNQEWRLDYDNTTDRLRFLIFNTSFAFNIASADSLGAVSTGVWYFIIARHNAAANTVSIQVNNGTVDSTPTTVTISDTTAPFQIGRINTNGLYWDGLIDEFSFWKRVLTADEGTTLYNGGNGLAYPFTVASRTVRHRFAGNAWLLQEMMG